MSFSKIWCLLWLINTWIQIHYPDLILHCLYVLYFTTRWIFNDSDLPHVLVTDPNILICLVWWIQLDYSFSTRFFPKLIAKNYETETVLHVIIIKLVLLANWIESFSLQMHVSCDPSFYWILLLIILTSNCISFPNSNGSLVTIDTWLPGVWHRRMHVNEQERLWKSANVI